MFRMNHFMPEPLREGLQSVSKQADISVAETLRKMVEYCLRDRMLNELFPTISGQINIGNLR